MMRRKIQQYISKCLTVILVVNSIYSFLPNYVGATSEDVHDNVVQLNNNSIIEEHMSFYSDKDYKKYVVHGFDERLVDVLEDIYSDKNIKKFKKFSTFNNVIAWEPFKALADETNEYGLILTELMSDSNIQEQLENKFVYEVYDNTIELLGDLTEFVEKENQLATDIENLSDLKKYIDIMNSSEIGSYYFENAYNNYFDVLDAMYAGKDDFMQNFTGYIQDKHGIGDTLISARNSYIINCGLDFITEIVDTKKECIQYAALAEAYIENADMLEGFMQQFLVESYKLDGIWNELETNVPDLKESKERLELEIAFQTCFEKVEKTRYDSANEMLKSIKAEHVKTFSKKELKKAGVCFVETFLATNPVIAFIMVGRAVSSITELFIKVFSETDDRMFFAASLIRRNIINSYLKNMIDHIGKSMQSKTGNVDNGSLFEYVFNIYKYNCIQSANLAIKYEELLSKEKKADADQCKAKINSVQEYISEIQTVNCHNTISNDRQPTDTNTWCDFEEQYRDVLGFYYTNMLDEWEDYNEIRQAYPFIELDGDWWNICYMTPAFYSDLSYMDKIGYAFIDLDNNGIPELLISSINMVPEEEKNTSKDILDLFTISDGNIVHIVSSVDAKASYNLRQDNTIGFHTHSGAGADITETRYEVNGDRLESIEVVHKDLEQCWRATEQRYDSATYETFYDNLEEISEEEFTQILKSWPEVQYYQLTPFSEYSYSVNTNIDIESNENDSIDDYIGDYTTSNLSGISIFINDIGNLDISTYLVYGEDGTHIPGAMHNIDNAWDVISYEIDSTSLIIHATDFGKECYLTLVLQDENTLEVISEGDIYSVDGIYIRNGVESILQNDQNDVNSIVELADLLGQNIDLARLEFPNMESGALFNYTFARNDEVNLCAIGNGGEEITSISITGMNDSYSLVGITIGMSIQEADKLLKSEGYFKNGQDDVYVNDEGLILILSSLENEQNPSISLKKISYDSNGKKDLSMYLGTTLGEFMDAFPGGELDLDDSSYSILNASVSFAQIDEYDFRNSLIMNIRIEEKDCEYSLYGMYPGCEWSYADEMGFQNAASGEYLDPWGNILVVYYSMEEENPCIILMINNPDKFIEEYQVNHSDNQEFYSAEKSEISGEYYFAYRENDFGRYEDDRERYILVEENEDDTITCTEYMDEAIVIEYDAFLLDNGNYGYVSNYPREGGISEFSIKDNAFIFYGAEAGTSYYFKNGYDDDYADQITRMIVVNCNEYVSLREYASTDSDALAQILKGEVVDFLETVYGGEFTHVRYNGIEGYVLSNYLQLTE